MKGLKILLLLASNCDFLFLPFFSKSLGYKIPIMIGIKIFLWDSVKESKLKLVS